MTRVAVVGGTGLVGRHVVAALNEAGHDPVVIARSVGVDVSTGEGLDAALTGAEAVIDVLNVAAFEAELVSSFFELATARLLAGEVRAGVGHHVVLSIVGIDGVEGNGHYAGKRRQEAAALAGTVPVTIQRATQFHEFAEMAIRWGRRGETALVPPLLVQPAAAADVAQVLVEVAVGPAQGRARDLAGPQPEDLFDMARRLLAARRQQLRLVPSWRGPLGVGLAGEVLLPGGDARLTATTFDSWLAESPSAPSQ